MNIDPGHFRIGLVALVISSLVGTQSAALAASLIVHSKFGGEILGYDIDPRGGEGLLSEYVTLGIGHYLVATETFDQNTGNTIKVVAREKNTTSDDYATQEISGDHLGLDLYQHNGTNFFVTLNPLNSNKFTGMWTPPIMQNYQLAGISNSQGGTDVAAYQATFGGSEISYVFSSNIAANTFGPLISLQPISSNFFLPMIALDKKTDQAVLAETGICATCTPHIALVNLKTGRMHKFLGLGIGSAEGLAVDSTTGIACTTTTIDQNVEFYDLVRRTGFLVHLPGAMGELQSGQDVQFDPTRKLFFVGQYTSTGNINNPQPRIYVYDERGNLKETIAGLQRIPIGGAHIALNPGKRLGYISVVRNERVTELQSFSY